MASETTTPNIGLQIPAFNQPNWQVPIVYSLNLLDGVFGGAVQVPALKVTTLTVTNVGTMLSGNFVQETPAGSSPGTTYTLSRTPGLFVGLFLNGILQLPTLSYTISGSNITLINSTQAGDVVYAHYFT